MIEDRLGDIDRNSELGHGRRNVPAEIVEDEPLNSTERVERCFANTPRRVWPANGRGEQILG